MERIQVYFKDCEASSFQKAKITTEISYYLSLAPSDASTCCCISKHNSQYFCNMRVHSAKGHIHIHRESKSLGKLLEFMYDSLEKSLAQWRKNPSQFAKSHTLGQTPCRDEEHQVILCPYQSYANKKFEPS